MRFRWIALVLAITLVLMVPLWYFGPALSNWRNSWINPVATAAVPAVVEPIAVEPVKPAAVVPAVVVPVEPVVVSPLLNCGEFGSYESILIEGNYEYWMEDQFKVSGAKALSDLKIDGGSCQLTTPDGFIAIWNQSAGIVTIDGEKGNLGNPVIFNDSENLSGSIVGTWDTNNDSAGVMLKLVPID